MTTVDNYFIKDAILDWAGNVCLGIIGINARNRLPNDIETFYLQKEKTIAFIKHTKATRFFEPIVAVKNDLRGFQRVYVSFQSTSSWNIASANALNEHTNFVNLHKKGRVNHKRQLVIEMKHARRII